MLGNSARPRKLKNLNWDGKVDLQEKLERELKTALLSGDKKKVETIRGLKNAIQYEAVNQKVPKSELSGDQIIALLAREAKKRQEAADLYLKAGEAERAEAELAEKQIIEEYLPPKLSEEEILAVVTEEVMRVDSPSSSSMGKIIGQVRGRLGAQADGAVIARLVKQVLENQ